MHTPGPPDAIPGEPMLVRLVTESSDLSNEAKEPMHLSASARMPYQKGFANVCICARLETSKSITHMTVFLRVILMVALSSCAFAS